MRTGPVFALVLALAASLEVPAAVDRPAEMLGAALAISDRAWDERAGLVWSPAPGEEGRVHRTRESTWYALGLLMRDQPGDAARAIRVIEQVLDFQFAAPGQAWDGTFRRAPEEPVPGPGAELWQNYDPNWRQFIGTTFVLMLEQRANRLPAELQARMVDAIRRAVEGELSQGRAEPYHTNIKLMHGFLLGWAGRRLGRAEWVERSDAWIEEIRTEFARHETFEEYNSPTYYGVDFYGLALCRRYGATATIRAAGAELEAGLWRDVGRFYHAGLKNMCGPFDRAYGMDMRRYVSLMGVWMGLVLPAELTPLPDPAGPMEHAHDFAAAPLYVALGAQVPDDVLTGFRRFDRERLLSRPITITRTATAWLGAHVMIGGEITGRALGATPGKGQFHPATIHWQAPGGNIGWVRLYASPPSDAEAGKETLTVTANAAGDFIFRISVPGLVADRLGRDGWVLPGLTVLVESDATALTLKADDGLIDVAYHGATRLVLHTKSQP
ncbi:MAG TPA: hypothetical protein VIM71_05425 [Lacunisphaera sp.]